MYYLLYEKEGLMKKFPLDRPEIVIGRGWGNDISLNDKEVSKKHCRVKLEEDHIKIMDLGSSNGTFVDNSPIREALISLNNSFGVGRTEFFFKRGDTKEFTISKPLSDLYSSLSRYKRPEKKKEPDTELRGDSHKLALQSLAVKALLYDEFRLFIKHVRLTLENVLCTGALFFIDQVQIHSLCNHMHIPEKDLKHTDWSFPSQCQVLRIQGRDIPAWKFPSHLPGVTHFLLYFNDKTKRTELPSPEFFQRLLEIIEVHLRLTSGAALMEEKIHVLYQDDQISIIGESPALKKAVELAKKIAAKTSFILILGESGTGKELVAKMIHRLSGRKNYVALNCAAIPASLLESELFGYERGAFTDARQRKIGKIEEASGGTLMLDEIGDMPLEVQAKLLRVIQEKNFTRLGGNETIPVDLRIIAMTNQDLYKLVEIGKFREDLFFRLRVHQLTIPPLRERKEDIPHLILFFTHLHSRKNKVIPAGFSQSAEEVLLNYHWPGNIRELENEISRILETIDDGELISSHHLLPNITDSVRMTGAPVKERLREAEKKEIEQMLKKNRDNKMKTARDMGISYRGFLKKLKRLGISKNWKAF